MNKAVNVLAAMQRNELGRLLIEAVDPATLVIPPKDLEWVARDLDATPEADSEEIGPIVVRIDEQERQLVVTGGIRHVQRALARKLGEVTVELQQVTQESGWELLEIDPMLLALDKNVRTEEILDERDPRDRDLIKNIAKFGVSQPAITLLSKASGALRVRTGQRRMLAARKAKRPSMPIVVLPETTSDERLAEIERTLAQDAENRHRKENTDADQLRTVQQLLDLGVSERQIADNLTISRKVAKETVATTRSELARRAVESHTLDLFNAGRLAALEATDPDIAASVLEKLEGDPKQVDFELQRAEDERDRRRKLEQQVAELEAAGNRVVPWQDDWEKTPTRELRYLAANKKGSTSLSTAAHAQCPGHAATVVPSYGAVRYVCTDYAKNGHTLLSGTQPTKGKLSDEERAARKRTRQNNLDMESANKARRAWIGKLLNRKKLPANTLAWIVCVLADSDYEFRKALEKQHVTALELLGFSTDLEPAYYRTDPHTLALEANGANALGSTRLLLAMAIGAFEGRLDNNGWRRPSRAMRNYFRHIASAGWDYPISPVERLIVDGEPEQASPDMADDVPEAEPDYDDAYAEDVVDV